MDDDTMALILAEEAQFEAHEAALALQDADLDDDFDADFEDFDDDFPLDLEYGFEEYEPNPYDGTYSEE